MIRVAAYLPDGRPGPGRLAEVELEATVTGPAELTLPHLTVRDERGGDLLDPADTLVQPPAAGGGPLAGAQADGRARAFGITNAAYHARRALDFAARLLDRPLPHLLVRIGMHDAPKRWGGGHYRLPGAAMPAEPYDVSPTGEVHLGGGRTFVHSPDGCDARYFHAPAHNASIVYHEVGHHICRHTADFRVNSSRPRGEQHNGKVALDEGTADFLAAVLLGTPDIYGWHRGHIPQWDPRRRRLDPRWTMAYLRPGNGGQAHANGTIWASALWSARERVLAEGGGPDDFGRMLLGGLSRLGACEGPVSEERDRRNRFSELLRELAAADPALAPAVLAAMADHGIFPEGRNAHLRERMRAGSNAAVVT
ncbi:hypothetical protein NGB36_17500 [Streptomyces sp. RB6PN25]|uniref:Uncharacterized protein n=1 Tax=Streptomyces humicola TaxID=2953240 RepID=A0ABT1PZ66_9ACTN|nr:hypothetical protein [Streptomyces humicola]MCQ4082345.1 hypothetical protein [Streptomyces humicola]